MPPPLPSSMQTWLLHPLRTHAAPVGGGAGGGVGAGDDLPPQAIAIDTNEATRCFIPAFYRTSSSPGYFRSNMPGWYSTISPTTADAATVSGDAR